MNEHPTAKSGQAGYLWDLKVNLHMGGDIQRISSRNHAIKTNLIESNHAVIELAETEKLGLNGKDFVLYVRDTKIEEPAVFMNVSPDAKECAVSVSILPNLRPLKLKE